jgi:hypothetical protein
MIGAELMLSDIIYSLINIISAKRICNLSNLPIYCIILMQINYLYVYTYYNKGFTYNIPTELSIVNYNII